MSIDHDQLFKQLLSTFFLDFLDLFFPEVLTYLEPDSLVFLEQEFFTDIPLGEKKLLDIVVKARFKDAPLPHGLGEETFFLIHVENQAGTQPQFARRMFRYFIRLFEKHDLPVYPIVMFSFNEPLRAEPSSFRLEFPGFAVCDFHFQVIQLNRLNWRDFLNRSNPVASALMSKMRIEPEDRPRVKLECLRLLLTLQLDPTRMKLISGFIDTYLRLNAQEQSQFAEQLSRIKPVEEQEQVMQIITSWMEEGIELGIERGLVQGRLEGRLEGQRAEALSMILRLLARRLGALSSETQQRIEQLSLTQLETLGEELLDFADLADLEQWFVLNA
ncbi:MAG: DUF4351 domain-containing protein [Gemmatimonadaceae bacterium]|nr:DUF4351 domain-containing protein [Gloeobacterales cyanobacterium ES-bin-141]